MDPAQFAGMSWDVWTTHIENQNKEQLVKLETNVNKLKKEDLKIFGRIVDLEPLKLHLCKMCGMVIKAQALLHHYMHKHNVDQTENTSCKRASSEVVEMESSFDFSTLSDTLQGDLRAKEKECDSSDAHAKDKSPLFAVHKNPKRLVKTRSPLGLMCFNKKKEVRGRNAARGRNLNSLSRKAASPEDGKLNLNIETNKTDESVEYLSHQLPGMTLNSGEEEKACGEDATTGNSSLTETISFMTNPPKALSPIPLFSCHKAGGLVYPGRHMKTTRNTVKKMLDEDRFSADLLLEIRKRRKNPFDRKNKSSNNGQRLTSK